MPVIRPSIETERLQIIQKSARHVLDVCKSDLASFRAMDVFPSTLSAVKHSTPEYAWRMQLAWVWAKAGYFKERLVGTGLNKHRNYTITPSGRAAFERMAGDPVVASFYVHAKRSLRLEDGAPDRAERYQPPELRGLRVSQVRANQPANDQGPNEEGEEGDEGDEESDEPSDPQEEQEQEQEQEERQQQEGQPQADANDLRIYFERVAGALDVMNSRFATIDGRFAKLEAFIGKGSPSALVAGLPATEIEGLDILHDGIGVIQDRLLNIEEALKKNQADEAHLEEAVKQDLAGELQWRTDLSDALTKRLGGLEDLLLSQSQKIDSGLGSTGSTGSDFKGALEGVRKDLGAMSGELLQAVIECSAKPIDEIALAGRLQEILAPLVATEVIAALASKLAPVVQQAVADEIKRTSKSHDKQLEAVEEAIRASNKRTLEASSKQLTETTTKIEARMTSLVPDIAKVKEFADKLKTDVAATCKKLEQRLENVGEEAQELADMVETSNNNFVSGFSVVKSQIPALINSINQTSDAAIAMTKSADSIARAMLEVIKMTAERNDIPLAAVRVRSEAIMQRLNDALDAGEDFKGKVSALGGGLIRPLSESESRPVIFSAPSSPSTDEDEDEGEEEESS